MPASDDVIDPDFSERGLSAPVASGADISGSTAPVEISDRDRAILDFEAEWSRHVGAKEEAIRADLALTPARYYQLLGRLLDSAEAVAYDPMLVKRLRRIRDAREQARLARSAAAL